MDCKLLKAGIYYNEFQATGKRRSFQILFLKVFLSVLSKEIILKLLSSKLVSPPNSRNAGYLKAILRERE